MSDEVIAQLLTSLKSQGEAIQHILNRLPATPTGASVTQGTAQVPAVVSHNITLEPFDPDEEDFSSYKERLENFLSMRGIGADTNDNDTENSKRSVLLGCLKRLQFQQLAALTAPEKPSDKSYKELVELLEKRFDPITNVHTERHKFLSRVQGKTESLTTYISALKVIAQKCNWTCPKNECKTSINSIFQAQFIRGVRDNHIREKILVLPPDTTLEKTLETALALEAAHKQNVEDYISENTKSTSSVNKVSNADSKNTNSSRRSRTRSQNQFRNRSQTPYRSSSNRRDKNVQRYQSSSQYRPYNREALVKLGLEDLCLACGKPNHTARQCRVRDSLQCTSCGKSKHIAKVCIASKREKDVKVVYSDDKDDDFYIHNIKVNTSEPTVFELSVNKDDRFARKIFVNVKLKGVVQKFELDTGSPVTILSLADFNKLKLKVDVQECPNIRFRAYNKQLIVPFGFVHIPVTYHNQTSREILFIVSENFTPILGRIWIRKLQIIDLPDVDEEELDFAVLHTEMEDSIFKQFADTFTTRTEAIPNIAHNLKLKPTATPVYRAARPIPFALLPKVNEELDLLEQEDIIEKIDYCQWGTPLVIVPKANGSVRLCADYKITVNQHLEPGHHPIPRVEELFQQLHGSTYFCLLDIYKAYLHVALDEESSKVAAISTHRGTYRVKRLFAGLATAPSIFHSVMAPILNGLDGCIAYFDDVLIHGKTKTECYDNLITCLQRLSKFKIHLNKDKCKFFVRRIQYLGHTISDKGLEKDPEKVQAIVHASKPQNVDELRSFLGLAQYYTKFVRNAASILHPLYQLLQNNVQFVWSRRCQLAFDTMKKAIASDQVLTTYTPSLPLVLETDASPFGLGAILSHKVDGELKPIAFISRSLTNAERRYSHLDKEATAIYWATKKFYQYLFGRSFTLITDNRPLQSIFNPNKALPEISALRLTRYALFLRQFDYTIQHRPGQEHLAADYLSRAPLPLLNPEAVDETYSVHELIVSYLSSHPTKAVTVKELRAATTTDPVLAKLRLELESSTSTNAEFSLHDGVIMRGGRVVIPEALQQYVLKELHSTHCGIVKMKALARSICYWRNIDKDIESVVKSCPACASVQNMPEKVPLHPWETPKEVWQRVHADFAGPVSGKYLFVVVDALSKWIEIDIFDKPPTSRSTLVSLQRIFAGQGIPQILVTDNASIFKSDEFEEYCSALGVSHRTSAPNHPASNGLAERAVQTVKRKLKALLSENPVHLEEKVQQILFQYRVTPLSSGKSPAELHMGRQLRTKLHLLKPIPQVSTHKPQDTLPVREYKVGSRVLSRNYIGPQKWKLGTVIERLGRVLYHVRLDNKYIIKRHANQLRLSECSPAEPEPLKEAPQRSVQFTLPPLKLGGTSSSTSMTHPTTDGQIPSSSQPSMETSTPESGNVPAEAPQVELRRSSRQRKPVQRLNL